MSISSEATRAGRAGAPRTPGLLLGLGLGAFVDGIVLHQVLQWHHMLTARRPATTVAGLELNTLADGLFHVGAFTLTVLGIAALWSWRRSAPPAAPPASRELAGWVLVGWGLFNLVEGLVDHHLLGVHHVREGPDALAWDLAFLALSAALVTGGWALQRGPARDRARDRDRDRARDRDRLRRPTG